MPRSWREQQEEAADYLKAEQVIPHLVWAGFGLALALAVALYFHRHRTALA